MTPCGRYHRDHRDHRDLLNLRLLAVVFAILGVPAPAARAAADIPSVDYAVQSWDNEAGLPSMMVTATVRTPDGFLWVGTSNGLARFDGQRFQESLAPGMRELRGRPIVALAGDDQGGFWAATDPPALYHVQNERAEPIPLGPNPPPLRIFAIAEYDRENLLLATDTRGLMLRRGTNWLPAEETMLKDTSAVVRDNAGELWVAGGHGRLLHGRLGELALAREFSGAFIDLTALAPARAGGVWIAIRSGDATAGYDRRVFHVGADLQARELPSLHWPSPRMTPTAIAEDKDGTVWLGTSGSGVYYLSSAGAWIPVRAEGPMADLIVRSLETDEEGSIWVGFYYGGMSQIRRRPVTALKLPPPARENIILCACATRDGGVWAGTDGAGAFRYQNGVFTAFGAAEGLTNQNVNVLLEDHNGILWAGTAEALFRFDGRRFQYTDCVHPLETPTVVSLMEDHRGRLWIGTPAGVMWMKDGTGRVFSKAEGIPDAFVIALAETRDGNIWAAIPGPGLFCQHGDTFSRYSKDWAGEQQVRSLWGDPDGSLWMSFFGFGIAQLKEGKFRRWTMADGLPDQGVHALFGDERGKLWFASNNGVFSCPTAELEAYLPGKSPPLLCERVSVEEGMASRFCTGYAQPVVARTADGRFWFPDRQTLAVFNPRDLPAGGNLRPAAVDSVVADDDRLVMDSDKLVRASSRTLRYEFHYTSPNLLGGGRLRFRYRLVGLGEKWVNSGSQRVAYYNQLAPGPYEFQVAVGGSDGTWLEPVGGQRLEVLPQWWQRRWLQAGSGVFGLGMIAWAGGAGSRARAKRRLRQLEMRAEVERERRRIARDLHDDLGSGLTELMLLAENAGRHSNSADEVERRVTRIAQRAQALAATTDEIVWTLNPVNDSLGNLAGYLCDFAQSYLSHSPVRCRLDITELADLPVSAVARHNLLLAFKEALNNVVKHSGATEVWVRIKTPAGRLEIMVEDNGRGFDSAQIAAGGNGLANFRERLAAAGGSAEIDSAPGRGTRVRFVLPIPD